jgi:hypothetical protein
MRGAVDPAREARDDDQVLLPKIMGEPPCEAARRGRSVARADDRHRLPVEQVEIALCNQQRRRILKLGEQSRVQPLP